MKKQMAYLKEFYEKKKNQNDGTTRNNCYSILDNEWNSTKQKYLLRKRII
ncbi:hypothetical protein [uncultured Chryseobacterium sp.]|nr:hypothetical protein [uncultured Chryseobacterium sp.]